MKQIKLLTALLIVSILVGCCLPKKKKEPAAKRTEFQIINSTDSAVTVWITLGATEGCIQDISLIPYITDSLAPLVGSFVLGAGDSTIIWSPDTLGFNGNITFNSQPLNCTTTATPNGVNLFEIIINNYFQEGNPQETVDISCVAGVNCFIKAKLIGGEYWNASSLYPDVDSIYNGTINSNAGKIGVFPYGCDTCTGAKNPPSCITESGDKQSYPICTVQRNAIGSEGGLIRIIYLGDKEVIAEE